MNEKRKAFEFVSGEKSLDTVRRLRDYIEECRMAGVRPELHEGAIEPVWQLLHDLEHHFTVCSKR